MEVALSKVPHYEEIEGINRTIKIRESNGAIRVGITDTGRRDDSVSGIHYDFLIGPDANGTWVSLFTETAYQCVRGDSAGQWTHELCP